MNGIERREIVDSISTTIIPSTISITILGLCYVGTCTSSKHKAVGGRNVGTLWFALLSKTANKRREGGPRFLEETVKELTGTLVGPNYLVSPASREFAQADSMIPLPTRTWV